MITLKSYGQNITVNEDEILQVVKTGGGGGYSINFHLEDKKAKDCLGEKISHRLRPRDIEEHDQTFLKYGYLAGMKNHNFKLTIKHAIRCKKIQKSFNVDGKKTIYDEQPFITDLNHDDKILNCTDEEFESYICGLVFATMNINQKGAIPCGIVFKYPTNRSNDRANIDKIVQRIKNHTCVDKVCSKYYNCVINSPQNITYFVNNIGLIDTSKLKNIHRLLWSKAYKVTKITKI